MGLDWNPGNKPKPGCEAEFAALIKGCRENEWQWASEKDEERFFEISLSPLETLDAPTVGVDARATEWVKQYHDPEEHGTFEEFLAEMDGFRLVPLCEPCDGIPKYSNGSPGGYVEPYSFRGAFLSDCTDVLGAELLDLAWESKEAPELAKYGERLMKAVQRFAEKQYLDLEKLGDPEDPASPEFHADVVYAAAKWCLFWAGKGHMLDAYF